MPTDKTTYLRFNHSYEFEDDGAGAYDGGVVEYSTDNGSTWQDAGSLFTHNGYNGAISNSFGNPLGGRQAFVRESNGYISSRANFSSLAGQNVRFRFRIGTDSEVGDLGWLIDDVRIYTCDSDDTTPPAPPVINSPPDNSFDTDGTITLSGTAEGGSTVEVFDGVTSKGTTPVDPTNGAWSKTLSAVGDGAHTYTAKATDAAGNTSESSTSITVKVDTAKPQISSTTPLAGTTNVARGTNLTASFSEKMMASSVNTTTFKLFKVNSDGTQTRITDVAVSLSSNGLKATLNPFGVQTPSLLLARNTKYKGVLTTGAKDLAGNSLAHQKSWTFTTKP